MTDLATRRALTRARAQGSLETARLAIQHAIAATRLVIETDPDADATDAVIALETAMADLVVYLRRAPR